MAKVGFVSIVDYATGKVCQHSDTSFVHNRYSNTCHTMRVHKRETPLERTELQKSSLADMITRSKVVGYFVTLAKAEAKQGQSEKMDALKRMRNEGQLYSVLAAAGRLYDPEKQMITFKGKNYAPGYVDPTEDEGSFGA